MDSYEVSPKITKDHWAFLDEIEAPMWVDLTLEAKSNYRDIDDGWFHTSHMFHQCSSLQLKAAFAHSGEGSASSDIDDMKRPSSPKLPSSVSRSRGKHYTSKKQAGNSHNLSLNKKHPVKALSGKTSWENSKLGEEIKPKLSFITSKGNSRSKTNLVVEKDLARDAKGKHFKAAYGYGDSEGSSSSRVDKPGESNTSTITSENGQELQQKNLEVSSQAFGNSSRLVSAMRIGLRKSCVSRPASRVDVGNSNNNNSISNRRQSRDSNSLSGKSSIGSSSNPSNDVKRSTFALMLHREQSPNSKNEERTIRATKNKVKDICVSKASNNGVKARNSNHRRAGTSNALKPTQKEAANSKVQSKSLRAKALLPHRVNEQRTSTGAAKAKEKVTLGGFSKTIGTGSENSTRQVPINQKCRSGDIPNGVMTRGQKATKQIVQRNDDRTRSLKGKMSSPYRVKHLTNATQMVVHLR